MNSEKRTIAILLTTAVLLTLAIVFVPRPATGQQVTAKAGDYLISTHKVAAGGDALYIADTRMGVIGVFIFDPNSRSLQLRALRPIGDAFVAP